MDGMPKKPCGRKQHAPSDAQRKLVQLHATVGTTQDMIARVIGIDKRPCASITATSWTYLWR